PVLAVAMVVGYLATRNKQQSPAPAEQPTK
ncbi:hypothetical protein N599_15740, partial [Saccharopolyspora erythraea D]